MRTIEERAKVVGTLSQFRSDYPYDKRSIMVGYIKGATDQKDIDDSELSKLKSLWGNETQVNRRCYIKGYQDAVEKSCELLKERLQCGVHPQSAYGFVDMFRKSNGGTVMKLGEFLLKVIFWSGMSQAEVAKKCNISTPVLNDIVKNRRGINVKYAKSFEALFGVPTMIWLIWDNIDKLKEE